MDIREFIEARLAEDEQGARNCVEPDWRPDGARSCEVYVPRDDGSNRTIAWCRNGYEDDFANALHIARHDPARVLREVAAKRAILKLHPHQRYLNPLGALHDEDHREAFTEDPKYVGCVTCHWDSDHEEPYPCWWCETVLLIASVWSDHPDFDPAWRIGRAGRWLVESVSWYGGGDEETVIVFRGPR